MATDGVVEEGASALDAGMLTGEPVPVEVGPGFEVAGATVNAGGRLVVRATPVGADRRSPRSPALGLARPTALLVGTGRGAQLGLLIRGPQILESTRRVDTVVLDKTGTVKTGRTRLVDALPLAAAGLLNPPIAGAAMALSSVSVVLDALRLRGFQARRAGGPARSR